MCFAVYVYKYITKCEPGQKVNSILLLHYIMFRTKSSQILFCIVWLKSRQQNKHALDYKKNLSFSNLISFKMVIHISNQCKNNTNYQMA